ncbi:WD40-repeat-containing domain protein [Zopfochytrium polystomum]|nr:WD40-repeat-containing domain protein [Zopfochytrium polystomum]
MEYLKIQQDFTDDIDSVRAAAAPDGASASFWLSLYNPTAASSSEPTSADDPSGPRKPIHFTVEARKVTTPAVDRSPRVAFATNPPSALDFTFIDETTLSIGLPSGTRTTLKSPKRSWNISKRISAIGFSPSGSLLVVGSNDGDVRVLDVAAPSSTPRLILTGHKGEITSARFFRSGQVMLTSSADLTTRVWGMLGENPVTLRELPDSLSSAIGSKLAHTRPVSDTGIIGVGRNVVTCSLDGSAWLWELGSSLAIRDLAPARMRETRTPIHAVSGGPAREFETDDKLALFACGDGSLSAVDLRVKDECLIMHSSSRSGLLTCSYDGNRGLVACGSILGSVEIYDLRQPALALHTFKRNESPVNQVFLHGDASMAHPRVTFANDEGSCALLQAGGDKANIAMEYVGVDIEPLTAMDVRGVGDSSQVVTGGREGIIRKY